MKTFFSDLSTLLKLAYQGWTQDNASRLSAALAYYTIFSLAPLLVIVIAIAGLVWDAGAVRTQVLSQVQSLVGAEGAEFVAGLMTSTGSPGEGILALVIGIAVAIVALPLSLLLGCSDDPAADPDFVGAGKREAVIYLRKDFVHSRLDLLSSTDKPGSHSPSLAQRRGQATNWRRWLKG